MKVWGLLSFYLIRKLMDKPEKLQSPSNWHLFCRLKNVHVIVFRLTHNRISSSHQSYKDTCRTKQKERSLSFPLSPNADTALFLTLHVPLIMLGNKLLCLDLLFFGLVFFPLWSRKISVFRVYAEYCIRAEYF